MGRDIKFNSKAEEVVMHIPVYLGVACAAVLLIGAPIAGCIDRRHRDEISVLFTQTYSNHLDIARNLISARNGAHLPADHKFTHEEMDYLVHLQINLDVQGGAWYGPR